MDRNNQLEENPIQKIEKLIIKVKLPNVKKTSCEKANFCLNTIFWLYFINRAKNFYAAKPLGFFAVLPVSAWSKSLIQFDFKINENAWTDPKKNSAPISSNCKNIAGQDLAYNAKNFHRLNKNLDVEWTMSKMGKPFCINQIKKFLNF